jgi:hypothetical protein
VRFFPVDDILPELKAAILANHAVILQVPAKPPTSPTRASRGSVTEDYVALSEASLQLVIFNILVSPVLRI